ncbi:uncharacterized protein N7506_007090 [Penicillium brevicompactum]|uniref:uncharacterized protein n=1 Tax=Penicillium brevicompactum TaxID=5074 RepID=UPI0025422D2C|nr:uncharacterized protein N7506_007090 [Penicillium brevicompactum]KAJ5333307.1 hypothetical protein N7506_007090 [Penicillium brevicompactum]
MPRIRFSAIWKAHRENVLLPLLLKECRTIDSARNELRWLREAVRDSQLLPSAGWSRLRTMCRLRSKGYPLQYILGNQPFGELEILCRKGVLIPRSDHPIRPETESYTYKSAQLVRKLNRTNSARPLRILDLCTGTGCISLLLHALLAPHVQSLLITGVDISPVALSLAQKNLEHNRQLGQLTPQAATDINFHRADVLGDGSESVASIRSLLRSLGSDYQPSEHSQCDLLISNPPYISRAEFRNGTTARSVRLFEPELALVPPAVSEDCAPEDIFYRRILTLADELQTRLVVLECGDLAQAQRVIALHERLASNQNQFNAEIWPSREQDLAEYGFHETDGSRCVIIQRL